MEEVAGKFSREGITVEAVLKSGKVRGQEWQYKITCFFSTIIQREEGSNNDTKNSLDLIQIRMGIKTGQGSGVVPRIRIIVVNREGLEVAHAVDFTREGTGELVLGKLCVCERGAVKLDHIMCTKSKSKYLCTHRNDLHLCQLSNLRRNRPRNLIPVAVKFQ